MKRKRVPRLRKRVIEFFENRCAYCRSSQDLIGAFFEVDHIIPKAKGGKTVEDTSFSLSSVWIAKSRPERPAVGFSNPTRAV